MKYNCNKITRKNGHIHNQNRNFHTLLSITYRTSRPKIQQSLIFGYTINNLDAKDIHRMLYKKSSEYNCLNTRKTERVATY